MKKQAQKQPHALAAPTAVMLGAILVSFRAGTSLGDDDGDKRTGHPLD